VIRLRGEHAEHPADDERRRLDAIDPGRADDAHAGTAIEIDDVQPAAVAADAREQIDARVRGDLGDRPGTSWVFG
jgi:hypothetical protein